MLVLAITLILMGVFFFYVRQRLFVLENRLELMSETIQTMAGVTRAALQNDSDEESESDESSESDVDEDSEALVFEDTLYPTPERVTVSDDDVKKISLPGTENGEEIEVRKMTLFDIHDIETELVKIVPEFTNDILDPMPTVDLDKPVTFESLTLKELKDKVAEYNGPKLKTKKELIEFLQNKI